MFSANTEDCPTLVIVMGVSGCGKSTLAKAIAESLGYEYIDADDFHSPEAIELMRNNIPLDDGIRAGWIQRLQAHLNKLAKQSKNCTLAFSGLKKIHREKIKATNFEALTIFIHGDKTTIAERMKERANHFMPVSLLDSQFDSLEIPEPEPELSSIDVSLSHERQLEQALGFIKNKNNT